MLIQHISDVHCEFHSDGGKRFAKELPVKGDVLVLPGDFGTNTELFVTLSELCKRFPHVIHVSGNHEYYGSFRGAIHNKLRKLAYRLDNFHPLNDNVVVIGNQRFVGSTLWWNALSTSPADMILIRRIMNDFRAIRGYSNWVGRQHRKSVNFLRDNIQEGDVVVTHHAPSWLSKRNSLYSSNSPVDVCYYNSLDNMIFEKRAKLWIHGHTHDHADYTIGQTRVVSSPHGYAMEGGRLTGNAWLDKYSVVEV